MTDEPRRAAEAAERDSAGEWRRVAKVPTETEARLLEGYLEAQGIRSMIEPRFFSAEPTRLSLLGDFLIHVEAASYEEASRIVAEQAAAEIAEDPEDPLERPDASS